MMRCMGLTNARRRCALEAIDAIGYCVLHQDQAMPIEPIKEPAPSMAQRRQSFFASLLKPSQHAIPDDVKLGVPGWLKKLSTETVIQHLLRDADSMRRWHAAFALRKRRDPTAIDPLWLALENDAVSMVRQQSAVALGKIGTTKAINPLIEALWHDRDAGVRQACAIALGNLGYPIAARDLAEVLRKEYAAFVRWDCVLALGRLGDRTVEPLLIELATQDRTEVVRNACREALVEIQTP